MLGHLRFHRRGHSNPSSPVPEQLSPFDHAEHPQSVQDISSRPEFLPRPTNASNTPPVHHSSSRTDSDPDPAPHRKPSKQSLKDAGPGPARPPLNTADSGFMGGVALRNYRRALESTRGESSPALGQISTAPASTRAKPLPPPINTNLPSTRPPPVPIREIRHTSSFVAPTDIHHNVAPTGKRPAGTRVTSELSTLGGSQAAVETQKGKKGLPFLKNPMSGLLMRRKASQNAPDLRHLPLPRKSNEATYDPRIRGTRVHDFSAPRQRVVPTRQPTVPGADVTKGWDRYHNTSSPQSSSPADPPLRTRTGKSSSGASDETTTPAVPDSDPQSPVALSSEPSNKSTRTAKRISLEDKALPTNSPKPALSFKEGTESIRSVSTTSRLTSAAPSQRTNPSTRTNRSRRASMSEDGTISLSALPKHMKSTSSRFSFDMVGAARAEKQLEERHRQRELERKANGGSSIRDSRFDDFDEDAFDYDAAMDDDGLEEAIPGVNADYDEDDYFEEETPFEEDVPMVGDDAIADEGQEDPDNDQENFAGFVFSRSNPQSSLVSPATPGMLITPRDATGRPIGHAITKDTTPSILSETSPLPVEEEYATPEAAATRVKGVEAPPKTQYDPTVFQERRPMHLDDVLSANDGQEDKGIYYDSGLLEELQMEADEIQKSEFDESIFDDDDVDSFGRPMPGLFAYNQAMRAQALDKEQARDSDITSPSGVSASTAHTSVSAGLQLVSTTDETVEAPKPDSPPTTSPNQGTDDKVSAYQRALAEAAQKAATSGWRSRWDDEAESSPSPPVDPDVTITSPTTGSQPSSAGVQSDSFNAQEYDDDDGFGHGFDDELDDDFLDEAFIAEANAEALAYDDDGFYGDEFGFYSAPVPARIGGHGSSGASSASSLGDASVYGGYFGPSGTIGRSASGRVLREPNLTPITERSEYSNRNSVLSMGPLSGGFGPGAADYRNSLTSPAGGLGFDHMIGGGVGELPMTLGDVARMRGKHFGGSQISLSSSRDGSPRSERAPLHERFEGGSSSPAPWEMARPQSHLGIGGVPPLSQPHERKNSAFSNWTTSEAVSAAGSPTVTMTSNNNSNNAAGVMPPPSQPLFSPPPPPMPQSSPVPQCPPVPEDEEALEDSRTSSPTTAKHGTPADSENGTRGSGASSPEVTVKGTPAEASEASDVLSRAGTFGEWTSDDEDEEDEGGGGGLCLRSRDEQAVSRRK